ncbi:sensor histidine kinase [Sinorhizobium meliloti]|uniref:sensor histidine kinase n=1 Tax=Rhizobium meliloti TaxID=382 RepID=UPI000FDC3CDB|nr:HAMP domain-containing sensor histidine kinase [Sinorhizobium meliloti]RVK25871.1 sensor histidine kinase [Sinorhizobium meliloti]
MARSLNTQIIRIMFVLTVVDFVTMILSSVFVVFLFDWFQADLHVEYAWGAYFIAFAIGLTPGVVVGWRLAHKIMRPLNSIATAVRSIASGDFSVRAKTTQSSFSEAEALIGDFNAMAARLERAEEELKYSNSATSHELRTPLTVLLGSLQGLADGVVEPSSELYELLICQVTDMTGMVEDLRTFDLANAGTLEIDFEEVDLTVEAEVVISSMEQKLVTAGITIEREFVRAVVLADPRRMRQVLLALLDNACRYAPGSTVVVQTFTAENRAGMRCLDTGPGMPLDAQARAFDRFWRGDNARACTSGGSGLGLSIVRAIARLHHGDATIDSNSKVGLALEVWVPLAQHLPEDGDGANPDAAFGSATIAASKMAAIGSGVAGPRGGFTATAVADFSRCDRSLLY